MFWIGMIVGVIIGVVGYICWSLWFTTRFTRMNTNEFFDLVGELDGVGKYREAEITITRNKGTESEWSTSVELEKE